MPIIRLMPEDEEDQLFQPHDKLFVHGFSDPGRVRPIAWNGFNAPACD